MLKGYGQVWHAQIVRSLTKTGAYQCIYISIIFFNFALLVRQGSKSRLSLFVANEVIDSDTSDQAVGCLDACDLHLSQFHLGAHGVKLEISET